MDIFVKLIIFSLKIGYIIIYICVIKKINQFTIKFLTLKYFSRIFHHNTVNNKTEIVILYYVKQS